MTSARIQELRNETRNLINEAYGKIDFLNSVKATIVDIHSARYADTCNEISELTARIIRMENRISK